MKTCLACGHEFPATTDYFYKVNGNGLQAKCKTCYKRHTSANRRKKWDHYRRVENATSFKRRTGMSHEERDMLLTQQGGTCAICGTCEPGKRGWHLDHDHNCCPGTKHCGNCIRGVLCSNCNTAIGLLRDDPSLLRAAADYLLRSCGEADRVWAGS